jgi:pimeloyl-ACP methyl ester carboxylesterase
LHWLNIPDPVKKVDVFYLYPTVWRKSFTTEANLCEIDNVSMREGSKAAFSWQATVFEPIGNIYAPYYRQADGSVLSLPLDQQIAFLKGSPTTDVVAAFDYYIKHFNHDRPFILAGHSQGSNVLLYLLSGYMKENPDVQKRMIAAYLIGFSVTTSFLSENPHLRFAEGPDDTGVIVSFNTQSPDVAFGANPVVWPGSVAINPITWTREETLAITAEGLGSYMPDATGNYSKVVQYADARVDKAKGVVICTTAASDLKVAPLPSGVYHLHEYAFYYFNIRDNATNRVAKFLGQH